MSFNATSRVLVFQVPAGERWDRKSKKPFISNILEGRRAYMARRYGHRNRAVNGKSKAIVLDAETYNTLMRRIQVMERRDPKGRKYIYHKEAIAHMLGMI